MARRYEFYVLVARTISHSFAALTREILFLPLENKIHIFSPPCNILYIFYLPNPAFFAGITESDICSQCATEKQTVNHLLYNCTVSKAFWGRFANWWNQKFKQMVNLMDLTSYTVGIITTKINRHLRSLFLLQNSIPSRQVHVMATYVLKAFFTVSRINLRF